MAWHNILGYIGVMLVAIAYAPKLHHLITKKCGANLNLRGHILFLVASVMLFFPALYEKSGVFIVLTLFLAFASAALVYYGKKYRDNHCDEHMQK
ncbi:MAG: hypothetical protein KDK50_04175 [Chlamydiia bacterium]|nr:hypothetical protein [Chlamydiia bacterium]MCP5491615.1 hypothetical protein [Chlamydiales bacterium]